MRITPGMAGQITIGARAIIKPRIRLTPPIPIVIVRKFPFGAPGFNTLSGGIIQTMWWKCDVQFFRTILRLKVWARNELEARTKVERMYQVATIQNITLADNIKLVPHESRLPQSAVH